MSADTSESEFAESGLAECEIVLDFLESPVMQDQKSFGKVVKSNSIILQDTAGCGLARLISDVPLIANDV